MRKIVQKCALLALVAFTLTSCGGGSSGSSPTPTGSTVTGSAPSADYAIPVGDSITVPISFKTNSATASASNLKITSLSSNEWSVSSSNGCQTVTGNAANCQIPIVYTPTAVTLTSTLTISFSYTDNASQARTGTVTVGYSTTGVSCIATPGDLSQSVINTSTPVKIVCNTGDSAASQNLHMTYSLPAGWSAPAGNDTSFSCATVPTTGNACQLTLTYAPTTSIGLSGLTLDYTYTHANQTTGTGQTTIHYSADLVPDYLYYANQATKGINVCTFDVNTQQFNQCSPVSLPGLGTNFPGAYFLALQTVGQNTDLYFSVNGSSIDVCQQGSLGLLQNCKVAGTGFTNAASFSFQMLGTTLYSYVVNHTTTSGSVTKCTVQSDGTFSNCGNVNLIFFPSNGVPYTIATNTVSGIPKAYVGYVAPPDANQLNTAQLWECNINTDGTFSDCLYPFFGGRPNGIDPFLAQQGMGMKWQNNDSGVPSLFSAAISLSNATDPDYAQDKTIYRCDFEPDGTIFGYCNGMVHFNFDSNDLVIATTGGVTRVFISSPDVNGKPALMNCASDSFLQQLNNCAVVTPATGTPMGLAFG